MKSVLFYWGKGAETRVKMVFEIARCEAKKEPCYLSALAERLGLSHVAVKKHLDLLLEEDYVKELNPEGRPTYVALSEKGKKVLEEFRKK